MTRIAILTMFVAVSSTRLGEAQSKAADAPSYAKQIQPLFAKYCSSCHNPKSAKGGLDLSSYKAMLEGSDNGPVLVPGVPAESILVLSIEGKAEAMGNVMFAFDLTYGGVFRILNVPEQNMHPLVMIECPRLLFPFAREIIAYAVRNGGFPPLLIDPVDFVGLYQQKMAEQQPQGVMAPPPG